MAVIYKLIWYQDGYEQPSEEDLKRIMSVSITHQRFGWLSFTNDFSLHLFSELKPRRGGRDRRAFQAHYGDHNPHSAANR